MTIDSVRLRILRQIGLETQHTLLLVARLVCTVVPSGTSVGIRSMAAQGDYARRLVERLEESNGNDVAN